MLTWGFLRAVDRQRSPRGPWSQIWSQFVLRTPFGGQLGPGVSASCEPFSASSQDRADLLDGPLRIGHDGLVGMY
jgi:hypothetical protein